MIANDVFLSGSETDASLTGDKAEAAWSRLALFFFRNALGLLLLLKNVLLLRCVVTHRSIRTMVSARWYL
jgi:hypothetical protein